MPTRLMPRGCTLADSDLLTWDICPVRLPKRGPVTDCRCLVCLDRDGSRSWSEQLFNRPPHRPVHLRYDGGHVTLTDHSNLGNRVGPHCRTGGKVRHLSGDCNPDFDAAFVVDFLKLFQAAAKNV